MNVLVIGSGGREHALCWKLKQSLRLKKLFCAPGNPGIGALAENVQIKVDQIDQLLDFAQREQIDLTIVGPEYPLSLGIVDRFQNAGLKIFGPTQAAAQLEVSKDFTKKILEEAAAPSARYKSFTDRKSAENYLSTHGAPVVLKADGLAAGKGVFVCLTESEIPEALDGLFDTLKAGKIVVEEFLHGKEASFIVAVGEHAVCPLAPAHDYKRIRDNDQGPNTGGMGTVSPTPNLTIAQQDEALTKIIYPVLEQMKKRGTPFTGFLYAGLMISPTGVLNCLEFNVRLGDPETQVIMRRLEGDLLELLLSLVDPSEQTKAPVWSPDAAVCVVLASAGYPESSSSGDVISGIEQAEELSDLVVFHAGTALDDSQNLCTAGGRVLNVTAVGPTIEAARQRVYQGCDQIEFRGKQLRRDIGKESQ